MTVWLNDGTLGDVINETLFNSKVDKTDFEEFKISNSSDILNLEKNKVSLKDLEKKYVDVTKNTYGYQIKNAVISETDQTDTLNNLISVVDDYTILYFPKGTYIFNKTIEITKPLTLLGESRGYPEYASKNTKHTNLRFNHNNSNQIAIRIANGVKNVNIESMTILNSNYDDYVSDHGKGIVVDGINEDSNYNTYLKFIDLYVANFDTNIEINYSFIITLNNVISMTAKNFNFRVIAVGGTLTNFTECWALGGKGKGYSLYGVNYSVFQSCAADYLDDAGYDITKCAGIALNQCGAETIGGACIRVLIDSSVSLNDFVGYNTNRIGYDGVPSMLFVENSRVINNNMTEILQLVPNNQSILSDKWSDVQHNNVKVIKGVTENERVSINGVYASWVKPTETIPFDVGTVKIVYNKNFNSIDTGAVYAWLYQGGIEKKWIALKYV